MTRDIRKIVSMFKKASNEDRYRMLSELMAGQAKTPAELSWRAKLCTALNRAKVYPEKPE